MNIFIGYDSREPLAYRVCRESIMAHSMYPNTPIVGPLVRSTLQHAGLYNRSYIRRDDGSVIDAVDKRPISTEFTYTRFLVPTLMQWRGFAIFCDSDFVFRRDPSALLASVDASKAVSVVKHDYRPSSGRKMRGQEQAWYPRKNWSSLIVWNCEHPSNWWLTQHRVNAWEGRRLHAFDWLDDSEIGELDPRWNWLEGHDSEDVDPFAVHFTRGTPDMPGYENVPYASEWFTLAERSSGMG